MRNYRAEDVSRQAADVVAEYPTGRLSESPPAAARPPRRIPDPGSLNPRRGKRDVDVRARSTDRIEFGTTDIDLSAVEQLVSRAQTRALGDALVLARDRFMGDEVSVEEVLDAVEAAIEGHGLDVLDGRRVGDLAGFRRFEFAAVLGRLRSLRVRVAES